MKKKFAATYINPLTKRTILEVREARDWRDARTQLPRWIYPGGTPHKRTTSPSLHKEIK